MAETYREIIKENVEYDFLVPRYGRERMDETVELMLETGAVKTAIYPHCRR